MIFPHYKYLIIVIFGSNLIDEYIQNTLGNMVFEKCCVKSSAVDT